MFFTDASIVSSFVSFYKISSIFVPRFLDIFRAVNTSSPSADSSESSCLDFLVSGDGTVSSVESEDLFRILLKH